MHMKEMNGVQIKPISFLEMKNGFQLTDVQRRPETALDSFYSFNMETYTVCLQHLQRMIMISSTAVQPCSKFIRHTVFGFVLFFFVCLLCF